MKILVCGGRKYGVPPSRRDCPEDDLSYDIAMKEQILLVAFLNGMHAMTPIDCVVHGGAPGGDSWGGWWAQQRNIEVHVHMAQWDLYGKAAGFRRNEKMLTENPDKVVAFPGGNGTADMVRRAVEAGTPVIHVPYFLTA